MEHTAIPSGEIHTPYQWVVADSTEREALVPAADDLQKLCLQQSDKTVWRLVALDPATWEVDHVHRYTDLLDKPTLGTAASRNTGTGTENVILGSDARLSDARPASDVSAWAKQPTKPSYNASEVGAAAAAHSHDAATAGAAGFMSSGDKSKLDGIATGATANATDAQLRDRSTHTGTQAISTIDGLVTVLGVKADLVDGKVAASQLPSYVDDVLEYANLAAFPTTGEASKIYTALDTNKIYRWSGSAYIEISASPGTTDAVPEGSNNRYFTEARAVAAVQTLLDDKLDDSQATAAGLALLGAADVAAQRNALGLANHNLVTVDGNGNSGFGTSSPFSSSGTNVEIASSTYARLWLRNTGTTNPSRWYWQTADTDAKALTLKDFSTGASVERLRVDANGNFGLNNVVPSWTGSSYKAIEGAIGSAFAYSAGAAQALLISNSYHNGTDWKYKNSVSAMMFVADGNEGTFKWNTAVAGTAGSTVSFVRSMTLNVLGRLLLGTPTDDGVNLFQCAGRATFLGNLGIGVATANRTLDVVKSSSSTYSTDFPVTRVLNSLSTQGDGATTFNYAKIEVSAGNAAVSGMIQASYDTLFAGLTIGTTTGHGIKLRVNGVDRVTLDASGNFIQTVNTAAATLSTNGTMTASLVSNTSLKFSVRGSDGVTRSATVALA